MQEYNDSLMHYGVKGMKWGVRRYQNSDGTLTADGKRRYGDDISLRKSKHVKKQIRTAEKSGALKLEKIDKKVQSKLNKTKEGKAYNNVNQFLLDATKQAKSLGGRGIVLNSSDAQWVNNIYKDYERKGKEILKTYADEYASETLKQLGYKNTEKGRQWIKDNIYT